VGEKQEYNDKRDCIIIKFFSRVNTYILMGELW